MRPLNLTPLQRRLALPFVVAGASALPLPAHALPACSSDGLAPPRVLVERFIHADCEACWANPSLREPGDDAVALDWIVPSARGDDAPLSTAALPEAAERLRTLGRALPAGGDVAITDLPAPPAPPTSQRGARAQASLRVGQGPAFNGYVGITVKLSTPRGRTYAGPYEYTLMLVESIAAQEEGSPVARNLVRNVLQRPLVKRMQLSKHEHTATWDEIGVMGIPDGANPQRLRLVGWVQDSRGRMLATAQSVCQP